MLNKKSIASIGFKKYIFGIISILALTTVFFSNASAVLEIKKQDQEKGIKEKPTVNNPPIKLTGSKKSYSTPMSWTFIDECPGNKTPSLKTLNKNVKIRFFEIENDKRTGETWPDNKNKHYIFKRHSVFKSKTNIEFRCAGGTNVCFGAVIEGTNHIWGLGLDGKSSCTSCCTTCPSRGWRLETRRLTCN